MIVNGDRVAISNDDIVCLSRIIGNFQTSCSEKTKNIIIEVGSFDNFNIRRTSLRNSLFTDSAIRFTQGEKSFYWEEAINIYTLLIKKYNKLFSIWKIFFSGDHKRSKKRFITFNLSEINSILNSSYSEKSFFCILKKCF